jgi:nitrogen fixation protein FixH
MFNTEKNNVMKKLIVLKFFAAILAVGVIFTLFTSCLDDNDAEIPPVRLEDLNGNYRGRLITVQGIFRTEKVIDFKTKKDTISFTEFPVKEIVKSVIKDPVKAEQALAAIGKVAYNLKYTSVLHADKNLVELTFAPGKLKFQIPVDGVSKNAVITLAAQEKGYFAGLDRSLRFGLKAEKIEIDGTELSLYEVIYYNFPYNLKY